jgi:hypothetical protein
MVKVGVKSQQHQTFKIGSSKIFQEEKKAGIAGCKKKNLRQSVAENVCIRQK